MSTMTIGRLAKATGVKVTTIRYYESIGVLETPARSTSGQRLYGEGAVQRLAFVRHARDLGFSMPSVRGLLALQADPEADCTAADGIARAQLADVRKRLAQLAALEVELQRIVTSCEGGAIGGCNVLAALNDHDQCAVDQHERIEGM